MCSVIVALGLVIRCCRSRVWRIGIVSSKKVGSYAVGERNGDCGSEVGEQSQDDGERSLTHCCKIGIYTQREQLGD